MFSSGLKQKHQAEFVGIATQPRSLIWRLLVPIISYRFLFFERQVTSRQISSGVISGFRCNVCGR